MKILKALLVVLPLMLITISSQAEVTVIVHPSNSANIDAGAIKKIFMGKTSKFPGGGEAVPINLAEGNAVVDEFNDKLLGKNSSQLKSYWSKLVFTGKGTPPKEVASEQEVIDLIANNPSLIGYVPAAAVTGSVKAVGSF